MRRILKKYQEAGETKLTFEEWFKQNAHAHMGDTEKARTMYAQYETTFDTNALKVNSMGTTENGVSVKSMGDGTVIDDGSAFAQSGPKLNQANMKFMSPDAGNLFSAVGDTSWLDVAKAVWETGESFGEYYDYEQPIVNPHKDQELWLNEELKAQGAKPHEYLQTEEQSREYYANKFMDERAAQHPHKYQKVGDFDLDRYNQTGHIPYQGEQLEGDKIENEHSTATTVGYNLNEEGIINDAVNYTTEDAEGNVTTHDLTGVSFGENEGTEPELDEERYGGIPRADDGKEEGPAPLEADYNFINAGGCKGAGCGSDPYKDIGVSAFVGAEGSDLEDALLQAGLKGHIGKTSQSGLGINASGEFGAQTNLMNATEGAFDPELFYKGKVSAGYTGTPMSLGESIYPGANIGGFGEYDSNSGINLGIEGGYGPVTLKGGYNVDTGSPFLGAGLNINFRDGGDIIPIKPHILKSLPKAELGDEIELPDIDIEAPDLDLDLDTGISDAAGDFSFADSFGGDGGGDGFIGPLTEENSLNDISIQNDMDFDGDNLNVGVDATPWGDGVEEPQFNSDGEPMSNLDDRFETPEQEAAYNADMPEDGEYEPINAEIVDDEQTPGGDTEQQDQPPPPEEDDFDEEEYEESERQEDRENRKMDRKEKRANRKPFRHTKVGQTFEKVGSGLVRIAKPLNRLLQQKEERKRRREMRKAYLSDNMYEATEADLSGSKGDYDTNTGIFRPDDKVIARMGRYGTEMSKASTGLESNITDYNQWQDLHNKYDSDNSHQYTDQEWNELMYPHDDIYWHDDFTNEDRAMTNKIFGKDAWVRSDAPEVTPVTDYYNTYQSPTGDWDSDVEYYKYNPIDGNPNWNQAQYDNHGNWGSSENYSNWAGGRKRYKPENDYKGYYSDQVYGFEEPLNFNEEQLETIFNTSYSPRYIDRKGKFNRKEDRYINSHRDDYLALKDIFEESAGQELDPMQVHDIYRSMNYGAQREGSWIDPSVPTRSRYNMDDYAFGEYDNYMNEMNPQDEEFVYDESNELDVEPIAEEEETVDILNRPREKAISLEKRNVEEIPTEVSNNLPVRGNQQEVVEEEIVEEPVEENAAFHPHDTNEDGTVDRWEAKAAKRAAMFAREGGSLPKAQNGYEQEDVEYYSDVWDLSKNKTKKILNQFPDMNFETDTIIHASDPSIRAQNSILQMNAMNAGIESYDWLDQYRTDDTLYRSFSLPVDENGDLIKLHEGGDLGMHNHDAQEVGYTTVPKEEIDYKKMNENYEEEFDFIKAWQESEMAKEMLSRPGGVSEEEAEFILKHRLENLRDLNVDFINKDNSSSATAKRGEGKITFYPGAIDPDTMGYKQGISGHEISHASNRPVNYWGRAGMDKWVEDGLINVWQFIKPGGSTNKNPIGTLEDEYFTNLPNEDNYFQIPGTDNDSKYHRGSKRLISDQDENQMFKRIDLDLVEESPYDDKYLNYVGNPTEVLSRLDSFRTINYLRNGEGEEGYYNPLEQKITEEQYYKLLEENDPAIMDNLKDLKLLYQDKDIIWMINNLADPNKVENIFKDPEEQRMFENMNEEDQAEFEVSQNVRYGGSFYKSGGEAEIDINQYKELIAAGADLEITQS